MPRSSNAEFQKSLCDRYAGAEMYDIQNDFKLAVPLGRRDNCFQAEIVAIKITTFEILAMCATPVRNR